MRWIVLSASMVQTGLLIAQVSQRDMDPGILSLVGNGVTVVVLAWYVYYDVKVRQPAQLAAFKVEQDATRAASEKRLAELVTAFHKEMGDCRSHQSNVLTIVQETFTREQDKNRDLFGQQLSESRTGYLADNRELRGMLFDNMKAMRVAVHDVKDTAQTLMTKEAVARVEAGT